jgi:hypothetical protein
VCRTLRDTVAHSAFWTEVDLTRGGGLTCSLANPTLLVALAPRLAATRVLRLQADPEAEDLGAAVLNALNAVLCLKREGATPSLSELALAGPLQITNELGFMEQFEARMQLLHALINEAPALARLDVTDAWCNALEAPALLSMPSLRMRTLHWVGGWVVVTPALVLDILAAAERHEGLQAITIAIRVGSPFEGADLISRLVDVAVARRLTALSITGLEKTASVALLARLLRECPSLRSLKAEGNAPRCSLHVEPHDAAILATALRANTTLQEFSLRDIDTSFLDGGPGAPNLAVCAALEGHPSITSATLGVMGRSRMRLWVPGRAPLLPLRRRTPDNEY